MAEVPRNNGALDTPKVEKKPHQARVEAIRDRAADFGIAKINTPTLNALEHAGVTIVTELWETFLKAKEGCEFYEGGASLGGSMMFEKDVKSIVSGSHSGEFIITSPAKDGAERIRIISVKMVEAIIPLGEIEWGGKARAFVRPPKNESGDWSAWVRLTFPLGSASSYRPNDLSKLGPNEEELLEQHMDRDKNGHYITKPNPNLTEPHKGK